MSYTIRYEPEKSKKYPIYNRNWTKAVAIVLIIVVLVGVGLRSGWLIPGDPEVTVGAFEEMIEKLREGKRVSDAVTVFCIEVLENSSAD